ncbi:hypothetical protein BJX99DRAFT_107854 [Aspergillus californicus]
MEGTEIPLAAHLSHDRHGVSHKRPRSSAMYQRKRAITACLPCRARKTKCDNIRPVCGFCASHEAQCMYADTANDHSSFDPASLAILDRINHAISLLEAQPAVAPKHHVADRPSQIRHQPAGVGPSLSHTEGELHGLDTSDELLFEIPGFPASSSNCESILAWPVFRGSVPRVRSFVLGPKDDDSIVSLVSPPVALGRGIEEENLVPLSKLFLSYVHTKNPILDVSEFTRYVRDAAETGLRWDSPSCLVLIACALGCLAMPFESAHDLHGSPSSSNSTTPFKEASAAYYLAAKKRLGLIEPSLLSVQCHFLCGVLEMYYINALRAWHYFNQACVQLQNLLWSSGHTESSYEGSISRETRRLEQRLYWSCMKSECELRCEIPLPTSGIGRFGFPDMLPSPPELLSPPSYSNGERETRQLGQTEQEEERSWFYYLAEISFRRLMNQALVAIGGIGEANWVNNLQPIIIRHRVLEEQIDVWYSHIPPQISIDQSEGPNNELAHYVRQRAIVYREWIHRPFLYYVIHQPIDDPFIAQATPLARKCLRLCVDTQLLIQPFHRHHGSWYVARNSMTRALLLLAAARSKKIEMPEGWEKALDHALQTLQYWAKEAPDLERAATLLQEMMGNV